MPRPARLQPDDEQTGSHQESGRLTACVKRPSNQRVTAEPHWYGSRTWARELGEGGPAWLM